MKNEQIENVLEFATDSMFSHPQHKEQIKELCGLMLDEIYKNSKSTQNECHLCIQSIIDLITQNN